MYGKEREVRKAEILSQIEMNFRKTGHGMTMYQIAEKVGLARNRCWVLVKEMLDAGILIRQEEMHRANARKYYYQISQKWLDKAQGDDTYQKMIGMLDEEKRASLNHDITINGQRFFFHQSRELTPDGHNYAISPPYQTS